MGISGNNSIVELNHEQAYEEADRLEQRTRKDTDGCTVFTGVHPEHGSIHIVIPAIGNGMLLLPFVVQAF